MDETYIKVSGQCKYLYRGVEREGETVDFLLTAQRDWAAGRRFLECAINLNDLPEKITIDKSGANTTAIESVKRDACVDIVMRSCKYLNNMVEQDHPTDAGFPILLQRTNHDHSNRGHAHDEERADGRRHAIACALCSAVDPG